MKFYLYNFIKLIFLQFWRRMKSSRLSLIFLLGIFIFECIIICFFLTKTRLDCTIIQYLDNYEILIWFILHLIFLGKGINYGVSILTDEKRPAEIYLLSLPFPLDIFSISKIMLGFIAHGITVIFLIPFIIAYKYLLCQNILSSFLALFDLLFLYFLCFMWGLFISFAILLKLSYFSRIMVVGLSYIILTVGLVLFTVFLLPSLNIVNMLFYLKNLYFLPFLWAYERNYVLFFTFSIFLFYLCLILYIKSERIDSEIESIMLSSRELTLIQKWNYITSNYIRKYISHKHVVFALLKKDLLYFSRNIATVIYFIPVLIVPFLFILTGKINSILIFPLYYIALMVSENFVIPSIVSEGYNIAIYKLTFYRFQKYFYIKILSGLIVSMALCLPTMTLYSFVATSSIQVIFMRIILISLASLSAVVSSVGVGILCVNFERGQQVVSISNYIGVPSYLVYKFFSVPIIFTIIDYLIFSIQIKSVGIYFLILFFLFLSSCPPFFYMKMAVRRVDSFE